MANIKDLGNITVQEFLGARPLNPFVETDAARAQQEGVLSSVQKRIVDFIESEANSQIGKTYGIQPPAIKLVGPDAERAQKELEKKQQEFFKKYQITKAEHDLLIDLVFYGELKLPFQVLGHTFLIRDLTPKTRRYIIEVGERISAQAYRAIAYLKIKAVAETFVEIDGVPLDKNFMEQYLWEMQSHLLNLLHTMHILTEQYKMHLYEKLPNFCRTPTSRLRYTVCQDMKIAINDPVFMNLSEEQIYWHYINAVKFKELDNELINDKLEYLTWFINPEAAKKLKETKDMHAKADLNKMQKYSFMNGIISLIQKDMSTTQISNAMDMVMQSMKDENQERKDPWDIPTQEKALDPNDPFIQALNRYNEQPPEEAKMGLIGGSKKWHEQ